MRRLQWPLCLFGLLLAGFPLRSSALFDDVEILSRELRRSTFVESMEKLRRDFAPQERTVALFDIPADSWYAPYVEKMVAWGLASGYRDADGQLTGAFGPSDPVTIAQMLKMALTASYGDVGHCPVAEDTDDEWRSHWAASFVDCGRGINLRLLHDAVDIDRPATRAEVLTIIHDGLANDVPPLFAIFKDTTDHPYESDIAFAAARGVVGGDMRNGKATGYFRPDDRVQRAEAVKMLYESLRADFEESNAVNPM